MSDHQIDTLSQLEAMLVQEATVPLLVTYFRTPSSPPSDIDESSRRIMVQWIQQVQAALAIGSETVHIAVSFFDRYLGSGRGYSSLALHSPREFQLAAIVCFYMAVKIHEPSLLGAKLLLGICRGGTYTGSDLVDMEQDILWALDWRVSCHSAMDFARALLELLPKDQVPPRVSDGLISSCQAYMDYAVTEVESSLCKPSALAIDCVARSLTESEELSQSEKRAIWDCLSDSCPVDISSVQISPAKPCTAEHQIIETTPQLHELSQQRVFSAYHKPSSPSCVLQSASSETDILDIV